MKNHTFFFMNYEQQNYREALTAPGTTPSAAWVTQTAQIMAKDGVQVNPLALTLINNLWPSNSLSGPAVEHNYAGAGINLSNSYNGVVKLDHQFNEKNSIAIRYFGGTGNQTEYVGSAMPYYFQAAPSRMHNFSLVYNAVISPRFVAQTLVGVNYFKQVFGDANHGFNMPALGFNDGVTNPTDFGSPNINISGFDSTGLDAASSDASTPPATSIRLLLIQSAPTSSVSAAIIAALAWTCFMMRMRPVRSHLTARRGRTRRNVQTILGSRRPLPAAPGQLSQSPNPSLDALADFLSMQVGIQHASIAYGNQQRNYYLNGFSFFGQDTWKITPKLTLNYGLNWVYQSPIENPANLISTFIPADGGITYVGTHGLSTLWPRDLHDFAPRFGFAFQPKVGGNW